MITNGDLTIYHKGLNPNTRLEEYTMFYYEKCWIFGGKGSSRYKGIENANDIEIRIPYNLNENTDISNFAIGDIIFVGHRRKYNYKSR